MAMVGADVELDLELEAIIGSSSTIAASIESISSCHCVVNDGS